MKSQFLLTFFFISFLFDGAHSQSVDSESLTMQCFKGRQGIEVCLKKSSSSCQVERIYRKKQKNLFEDKQSPDACQLSFQRELSDSKWFVINVNDFVHDRIASI